MHSLLSHLTKNIQDPRRNDTLREMDAERPRDRAKLECRRLAPAWKLVSIVLNTAWSFDCCVVHPEALASFAQELDEIVDALLPMFAGQDRLEHASSK